MIQQIRDEVQHLYYLIEDLFHSDTGKEFFNLLLTTLFSLYSSRVCRDKATGAHYGVPTCEGCKVNL